MQRKPRFCHVLNLHTLGGVQRSFAGFLQAVVEEGTHGHYGVIGDHPHAQLGAELGGAVNRLRYFKRLGPLKIPPHPKSLRQFQLNRLLARARPDVVVLWNHARDVDTARHARSLGARVVYFEHGAAWSLRKEEQAARALGLAHGVVAVSHAARRVLELRWNVRQPIRVQLNALLPASAPFQPTWKTLDPNRPLVLGTAGRLVSLKGISLALRTLSELRKRGVQCELRIAGTGPQEQQLRDLSKKLGISDAVRFLGLVGDMGRFFSESDIFLYPSLGDAYGLVSLEAQAWGCPVLTSRIDGLPETLLEGRTGYTVPATLSPSEFPEYRDGRWLGERLTYDPEKDRLMQPRLPAPEAFADYVMKLIDSPTLFAKMSDAASKHAAERSDFARYSSNLVAAFRAVASL
ncbi:glycosyltransferase family 4 protein [Ectothiorhodospiraceae bacterium 2226]|nr:glycosyltransferase family 4 protein [Ectothiorhodospiraceae bacterium 2226]